MRTSFIIDEKEIEQTIQECDICYLGIVGENNEAPYVIPMNFGYKDGEFILHSGPHGKHLDLLRKNNKVSITLCSGRTLRYQHPDVACSYSMESKSIVCTGTVSFVDDEDLETKEALMNCLMKNYSDRKFTYSKPALRNVKVWRIKVEELSAKSFGQNFRTSF